jgi:hypothetical protein
MAKLTPAQMKKAVEEFKKQFTGGFYHGSPSNKIKAFDSSKAKDPDFSVPGVTFVTRDPDFADSFLPTKNIQRSMGADAFVNREGLPPTQYKTGATMYPVSVNLGKHFDPGSEEAHDIIMRYTGGKDNLTARDIREGSWTAIEHPDFLNHLKKEGFDTFTAEEGGIPNIGIFDPKNIRGKFAKYNPEDAESADFMKAAGGRIAKKVLEHAKSIPFVHYSQAPNISTLDPNMYGRGIKGAEAARLKDAPDIKPRSYFYTQAGGRQPEQGLGPHKYQGIAEDIYPLHDDPAGYSAIAKQKAIDPYMMQFGREVVDQKAHLNELERLIKGAGYKGYANDDVGLVFHPTDVQKSN